MPNDRVCFKHQIDYDSQFGCPQCKAERIGDTLKLKPRKIKSKDTE